MFIAIIIIFLTIHASVSAKNGTVGQPQLPLTQISNLSEYGMWNTRLFSVDTTSPVTNYIRSHPEEEAIIVETYDFIETVWNAVQKRREEKGALACNLKTYSPRDWTKRIIQTMAFFQIGFIDTSCYSQIDVVQAANENEIPRDTVRKARNAFRQGREAFSRAYEQLRLVPDGNWSSDGKSYDMPSQIQVRAGQKCTIDTIVAYRKQKVWYLDAKVTNAPLHISKAEHTRHFIHEYVPRNGTVALQMVLPNVKTEILEQATTIVTKWGGFGFSPVEESFDDPISPLSRAYQQNLVDVDLASDSITVSNIAILALPMVMNLIPISFVADVHTLGMLIYVIVTDVCSTIPFLIKGLELISSSRPQNDLLYTFFSGNESLGSMESWIVDCKGEEQFGVLGIIFVSTAISAILIGVAFELWAQRFMTRKKSQFKDPKKVDGPFGTIQLQFQHFSPLNKLNNDGSVQNTWTGPNSQVLSKSLERYTESIGYSVYR